MKWVGKKSSWAGIVTLETVVTTCLDVWSVYSESQGSPSINRRLNEWNKVGLIVVAPSCSPGFIHSTIFMNLTAAIWEKIVCRQSKDISCRLHDWYWRSVPSRVETRLRGTWVENWSVTTYLVQILLCIENISKSDCLKLSILFSMTDVKSVTARRQRKGATVFLPVPCVSTRASQTPISWSTSIHPYVKGVTTRRGTVHFHLKFDSSGHWQSKIVSGSAITRTPSIPHRRSRGFHVAPSSYHRARNSS